METGIKTRRSVIKKQKREAAKEANKKGPAKASLLNIPTSPRKMRLVADLVRGQKVNKALGILKFQAKKGAADIEKLLLTAIADWQAKNADLKLEEADLFIKEIYVNEGRMLKRMLPAPQGRAYRVRKRSNHITLVVDSKIAAPAAGAVVEEKEAEGKEKKATAKKTPAAKKSAVGKAEKPAAKKKTATKKTEKK
jgi:large subunit ribosomal protein L22